MLFAMILAVAASSFAQGPRRAALPAEASAVPALPAAKTAVVSAPKPHAAQAAAAANEPAGPSAPTAAEVTAVASALNRGDWSDAAFFDGARSVVAAREAHEQGLITQGQMATTALRWQAAADWRARPRELEPRALLTKDGRLSDFSRRVFGRPRKWLYGKAGLDRAALDRFETLVRELPPSERVFWVIRRPRAWLKRRPWVEALLGNQGLYDLLLSGHYKVAARAAREIPLVVPSFGVMQAVLDAQFPGEAVRLLPAFGDTPMPSLMAGIAAGGRVLGLTDPRDPGPFSADGFETGRILFSLHDLYHATIGARQPAAWRRMTARVYRLVSSYRESVKLGDEPQVALGRPLRLDPHQWALSAQQLGDLTTSKLYFPDGDVEMLLRFTLGLDEQKPTGPLDARWVLVARDLALEPELWRGYGVDPEFAARRLPPPARAVYLEAKAERRAP